MNVLHIILSILLLLGMFYVYIGYKEGFTLKPGEYPNIDENPILVGDYPVKQNAQLSNNNSEINSKMDSYTPMSSYQQTTNNVKNWVTPDNGTCSPADFCGALYNKKVFNMISNKRPNDTNGIRVNYYISEE